MKGSRFKMHIAWLIIFSVILNGANGASLVNPDEMQEKLFYDHTLTEEMESQFAKQMEAQDNGPSTFEKVEESESYPSWLDLFLPLEKTEGRKSSFVPTRIEGDSKTDAIIYEQELKNLALELIPKGENIVAVSSANGDKDEVNEFNVRSSSTISSTTTKTIAPLSTEEEEKSNYRFGSVKSSQGERMKPTTTKNKEIATTGFTQLPMTRLSLIANGFVRDKNPKKIETNRTVSSTTKNLQLEEQHQFAVFPYQIPLEYVRRADDETKSTSFQQKLLNIWDSDRNGRQTTKIETKFRRNKRNSQIPENPQTTESEESSSTPTFECNDGTKNSKASPLTRTPVEALQKLKDLVEKIVQEYSKFKENKFTLRLIKMTEKSDLFKFPEIMEDFNISPERPVFFIAGGLKYNLQSTITTTTTSTSTTELPISTSKPPLEDDEDEIYQETEDELISTTTTPAFTSTSPSLFQTSTLPVEFTTGEPDKISSTVSTTFTTSEQISSTTTVTTNEENPKKLLRKKRSYGSSIYLEDTELPLVFPGRMARTENPFEDTDSHPFVFETRQEKEESEVHGLSDNSWPNEIAINQSQLPVLTNIAEEASENPETLSLTSDSSPIVFPIVESSSAVVMDASPHPAVAENLETLNMNLNPINLPSPSTDSLTATSEQVLPPVSSLQTTLAVGEITNAQPKLVAENISPLVVSHQNLATTLNDNDLLNKPTLINQLASGESEILAAEEELPLVLETKMQIPEPSPTVNLQTGASSSAVNLMTADISTPENMPQNVLSPKFTSETTNNLQINEPIPVKNVEMDSGLQISPILSEIGGSEPILNPDVTLDSSLQSQISTLDNSKPIQQIVTSPDILSNPIPIQTSSLNIPLEISEETSFLKPNEQLSVLETDLPIVTLDPVIAPTLTLTISPPKILDSKQTTPFETVSSLSTINILQPNPSITNLNINTVEPTTMFEAAEPIVPVSTLQAEQIIPVSNFETAEPSVPVSTSHIAKPIESISPLQAETILPVIAFETSEPIVPVSTLETAEPIVPVSNFEAPESIVPVTTLDTVEPIVPFSTLQNELIVPVIAFETSEQTAPISNFEAPESIVPVTNFEALEPIIPVLNFEAHEQIIPVSTLEIAEPIAPLSTLQDEVIVPVIAFETSEKTAPISTFEAQDPIVPVSNFEAHEPIVPVTNFEALEPIIPVLNFEAHEQIIPVSTLEIAEPIAPLSTLQDEVIVPVIAFETFEQTAPISTFEAQDPIVPVSNFEAHEPIIPVSNFETSEPIVPVSTFEAHEPIIPVSTLETAEPIVLVSTFEAHEPIIPVSTFETAKPIVPLSTLQDELIVPVIAFETSEQTAPILTFEAQDPIVPVSNFEAHEPIIPVSNFETSEPIVPVSTFEAHEPIIPVSTLETSKPIIPVSNFEAHELKIPVSTLETSEPIAPLSTFEEHEPIIPVPVSTLETSEPILPVLILQTSEPISPVVTLDLAEPIHSIVPIDTVEPISPTLDAEAISPVMTLDAISLNEPSVGQIHINSPVVGIEVPLDSNTIQNKISSSVQLSLELGLPQKQISSLNLPTVITTDIGVDKLNAPSSLSSSPNENELGNPSQVANFETHHKEISPLSLSSVLDINPVSHPSENQVLSYKVPIVNNSPSSFVSYEPDNNEFNEFPSALPKPLPTVQPALELPQFSVPLPASVALLPSFRPPHRPYPEVELLEYIKQTMGTPANIGNRAPIVIAGPTAPPKLPNMSVKHKQYLLHSFFPTLRKGSLTT